MISNLAFGDITLSNVEQQRAQNPETFFLDLDFGDFTHAGVNTNRSALGYSPVYRGINLIAGDVARIPLVVYKYRDDSRGRERATSHPAYSILRQQANRSQTINVMLYSLVADAILHQGGFAWVDYDRRGAPAALIRLDPRDISTPQSLDDPYRLTLKTGRELLLDQSEVVHIRRMTVDGYQGIGLLRAAAESIGLGVAARTFGSRFFANQAAPQFAIELPPGRTMPTHKQDLLREQWDNLHRGLGNSHRPAVLEGGAKLHAITVQPKEAQLLELRKFELVEVANFLGCPPHLLGDDSRTSFASLDAERQTYLDQCLDPWLTAIEHEVRAKLLTSEQSRRETHTIEFMREALVKADLAARTTFYRAALDQGIMSRNEIRSQLNLNAVEGGDTIMVPLNMAPLGSESPAAPEPDEALPVDEDSARLARAAVMRFSKRVAGKLQRLLRDGENVVEYIDGPMLADFQDLAVDMIGPAQRILNSSADWYALAREQALAALETRRDQALKSLATLHVTLTRALTCASSEAAAA